MITGIDANRCPFRIPSSRVFTLFRISAGKVDMRSLQVRLKKDIKTERRGARRRTANFAMISAYRKAMRYAVVTGKTEKRYQDGAGDAGRGTANFAMISECRRGNTDIRSLQVRREKRYQDGGGEARRMTVNFAMISACRRARSICGRYR